MTAPSTFDLVVAAALLLVNAGLSIALGLGLARSLLISGGRMILQLLLLALVLGFLFRTNNLWLTLASMAAMAAFAGVEVMGRQKASPGRVWTGLVGSSAILFSGWLVVLPALVLMMNDGPWYSTRVALPMFGMVAGQAMTGASLAMNSLAQSAIRDARVIEAQLALGATRTEALRPALAEAVRTGLMPTVNAMAAIGLVRIPGMMTGQLLAGAGTMDAARYQMFLMFLISGATGLAVLATCLAMLNRISDPRHRLRLDRLKQRK